MTADIRFLNELPNNFERRAAVELTVREAFESMTGGRWLVEIRPARKANRVIVEVTAPGQSGSTVVEVATWETSGAILARLRAAGAVGG